ncbi:MAG: hypothetical protein APR53_06975 [Methanoculleus sp. SDB]|nr:MAG: hypothetical protein APR53_06975 [Methanoculleus sp. SDB]
MTRMSWEMKLGIFLVAISAAIYTIKFIFLGDPENTYYYVFNALGFLPINVLLVTIVLNSLLSIRSRREKLQKLNMVIGTFFSEVGTGLLTVLSEYDPCSSDIREKLVVQSDWVQQEFDRVNECLTVHPYEIDITRVRLQEMKDYLQEKRNFLLRLLENPVLLEHESFTELLRAVFHLTEELERRDTLAGLPESDYAHLSGDITRVYGLLVRQWVDYMHHLKDNYPYLFSLAMRTNPFDSEASAIVRQ